MYDLSLLADHEIPDEVMFPGVRDIAIPRVVFWIGFPNYILSPSNP